MITYIHYGSDHFYPEYFTAIRNGENTTQPAAGTGLWASRADDKYGWEKWCRRNHFNLEHLKTSFRFELPGASIFSLEDPDQLCSLPKLKDWEPKLPPKVKPGELPTQEQLRIWFSPNPCYLDFEKLAKKYDAILSDIWCADTCAPRMRDEWSSENKTLGQCSITAFLIQDIFGGKVRGILRPGGNYHCFNDVDGCVFDLTSEQFGDEVLDYSDCPEQLRETHFAKEEKRQRYEYLRSKVIGEK